MKRIGESIVSILILILCVGFFGYFGDGLFGTISDGTATDDKNTFTEESTPTDKEIETNLYLGIKKYGCIYDTNPFENAKYYGWIDNDNGDISEAKSLNELTDVHLNYGINLQLLAYHIYCDFADGSTYTGTPVTAVIEFDNVLDIEQLNMTIMGIQSIQISYEDGTYEEVSIHEYENFNLTNLVLEKPSSNIKAIAFNYEDLGIGIQEYSITYGQPTSNTLRVTFYENNDIKFSDLYVSTSSAFITNDNYADYVIFDFTDLIKKYCDNKPFEEWVIKNKNYILITLINSDIISASYTIKKDGLYLLESTPKSNGQDIGLKWSETYEQN